MASNKTPNIGLNSWAATDYVKRTEFNDNFTKIDTEVGGLKGNVGDATALQTADKSSVVAAINENTHQIGNLSSLYIYINDPKYGAKLDGVTDDTDAMQAVFNDAIAQHKDIMTVGNILINGSININRDSSDRVIINVIGSGTFIKNNSGNIFTSTNTNRNGGNIRFSGGVSFQSTSGAGTSVFDGTKLIRMYFEGVDFLNVDNLFTVPFGLASPYNYSQTIYLSDCTIVGGSGYFINTDMAYDLSFSHNIMEQRDAGFYVKVFHSVRIIDNLIEGMTGRVFYGNQGRALNISDNYMESNATITNQPYIEFFASSGLDVTSASVTIENNLILGSTTQQNDQTYYAVKFDTLFKNTQIGVNSCSTNLYQVVKNHTIKPEFLKKAYCERIETNGRYCVNTTLPQPVITGGQSLIRDAHIPFGDSAGIQISNPAIVKVTDVSANVTLYTTPELAMQLRVVTATAQAGFSLRNITLSQNVNYVIGISGNARLGTGAQPNTLIKVLDGSNNVVWSYSLDWQNQVATRRIDNFFSLPPFTVSTTGTYKIQVELDPSGGLIPTDSGLYIGGVTIQTGTIATSIEAYKMDGLWNGEHMLMGSYHLWVDSLGKLRIKSSAPTSDTDGSTVGSQT